MNLLVWIVPGIIILLLLFLTLAKGALQTLLVRRRLLGASGNGRTARKNQLIEVKQ